MQDVTTYRIQEMVYLVIDQEFAYVYTPAGEYVGTGEGFTDYLDYMGNTESDAA